MVYFASGTKAGQHAAIISSSIVDPTTIGSSFVSVVPNVVKRESKETQFIAVSQKKKKRTFFLFWSIRTFFFVWGEKGGLGNLNEENKWDF